MQQSTISNEKDISRILELVLKVLQVHYFDYILFHTYLKVTKLVLLKTRLNKFLEKKKHHSKGRLDVNILAKTNWVVYGPSIPACKNRAEFSG